MTKSIVDQGHRSRGTRVSDAVRIARYPRHPERGPKMLFFSGGTALNGLSRHLKAYTHNSIHLVTPFDSGGSSAVLRQAFDMPAVGDLRHRSMALANESMQGSLAVCRLCRQRLPQEADQDQLRITFEQMVSGSHDLMVDIPKPLRQQICTQLQSVHAQLPSDFNLRRASVGNLILAGAYLSHDQDLDAALGLFSELVSVQGTVRAIVNDNIHLGAELADGARVIGQHKLTGKEVPPIQSPVSQLVLTSSLERWLPVEVGIEHATHELIAGAELICYAPGSFYSSLMATLLPVGVASAIAASTAPKILIPNLGSDPEQLGMGFDDSLRILLKQLCDDTRSISDVLNCVVIDSERGHYTSDVSRDGLRAMGVKLIDLALVSDDSAPYYDDQRLLHALLSLIE